MTHINTYWHSNVPQRYRGVAEYYPDVIVFELNQIQYSYLWQELSSASYIYTNGYEIRPTNWFMYAFQTVKGWFGFENYCHPEKVAYTLNKLAYYGFQQRFVPPDFLLMTRYTMSSKICALAVNQHNDHTTAQFQIELINSFFKIEPYLGINNVPQYPGANFCFGESWANWGLLSLVPLTDPQDNKLIAAVIVALDKQGVTAKNLDFLPKSKYARTAAQYYCDKAQNTQPPSFFQSLFWTDPRPGYLAEALVYDPEIAKRNTQKFIEYYLQQKNYQNVFHLLELLSDDQLILKFLLDIPETNRTPLIQKDSRIAAIMACHYIANKQYFLAQLFYTNIEKLSPIAAFAIALYEEDHGKAYDIFKKHESTTTFSMSDRQKLANVFFDIGDKEYEAGRPLRANKQWTEAELHYLRSLVQKKNAHHLNPSEQYLEELHMHKRLYAMLLISADIDLHPAEESDIARIQKAITLLRECDSHKKEEQEYQKTALANGLIRRVDTLREKIAFTYTPYDDNSLKKHKIAHQEELSAFIKTLKEVITLLTGTKDKELCLKLGKAHYLLADVQEFFDINDSDINQHYKLAMEIVPENPFYVLRVAELFQQEQEKLQGDGLIKLKKMGYEVMDFYHWSEERWVKRDHIIYGIKDIHELQIELGPVKTSGWSLLF